MTTHCSEIPLTKWSCRKEEQNHSQYGTKYAQKQESAKRVFARVSKRKQENNTSYMACVVYLLNRSLTRSVLGKTPQEAWNGRKPDIFHLRVFGSIAHVHVPDEQRNKLDDKSEKFIFIGYD
ncbi:hypothetical protein Pfo_002029, partial [Paulownia fortunei]